ncbi:MAG: ABC transporter permease [Desulfarculus sp.]|nr:ABC transporter permease [Pseudomonadota bacterium]MBV1737391.1 ABC transporter permease [Desulfarculus sp.]
MSSGIRLFHSLKTLMSYRRRLLEGVLLDVRQQYTGSVLGIFWAVLFPLLQLSIFAALYTVVFKVRPVGLTSWDYVLLVFSGLVPLLAFTAMLTSATGSLTANKNLLLNTVFPAEMIPLRSALAAHVPGVSGLIITLLLGYALGRTSWQALVVVPLVWLLLVMFSVGLCWMLSLLSLIAKDIQHVLGIILMLMMILSPYAYTPEMVPSTLRFIIYLNPMSYFVLACQQVIAYGVWPDPIPALGSIALGLGGFLLGYSVFLKAKFLLFDYA